MQLNSTTLPRHCRLLLREGRTHEALSACNSVLDRRLSSHRRCRVLQLKARLLASVSGEWAGPALACLKEALELTGPDTEERGRVLVSFTAAYAALGSPTLCKEYRDAFLFVLRRVTSLQRFEADVEYNLGLAYHELDHLVAAESAYVSALGVLARCHSDYYKGLQPYILHNLTDIYQELGRHDQALRCMEAAYPALPDDTLGAQMNNRRAICALAAGDLAETILWVESGLGHPSCDARTRAALMLTKARLALASGDRSAAKRLATEALRLAGLAHSSRLSHRIARFLSTTAKGEPE